LARITITRTGGATRSNSPATIIRSKIFLLTRKIHEDRAQALGITPEESLARMIARIPLGRIESPDDIASAVSFLCSPDAAYITGQALNVCGGMEMD